MTTRVNATPELVARCPECNRGIRLPLMRYATEFQYRTCRGCGERWYIKTDPVPTTVDGMMVHVVTFDPAKAVSA